MNRQQIYGEMQELMGVVPTFFKVVPNGLLEHEWEVYKKVEIDEGPIPMKYRQLIGLCLSAVTKCKYCLHYHTEFARAYGATDSEIDAALQLSKSTIGWSTYVTGLQLDFDQFKQEIKTACDHLRTARPMAGVH